MRVSDLLTEARKKHLNYETVLKGKSGEIDKVIVKLAGKDSEGFTKLAKEYKELKAEMEALQEKVSTNSDTLRARMEELFDPADDVLTRLVETCSLTLQLAKAVQPSSKTEVNYEKAFNELLKLIASMVPELKDRIHELTECAKKAAEETKTSNGKKSAFTVKEGVLGDLAAVFKALRLKVSKWISKYDNKLSKARADMAKLQSMPKMAK